jgi:hypothetical protein
MIHISQAKTIADLLDRDPIMARLVKEHVKPDRLIELLELPTPKYYSLDAAFPDLELEDLIEIVDAWLREYGYEPVTERKKSRQASKP